MSDGYGTILVTQSENFEGDIVKICSTLNNFEGWSSFSSEFEIRDNLIHCKCNSIGGLLQYPSASPNVFTAAEVELDDGSLIEKQCEDLTEVDYDNMVGSIYEKVPLEILSASIGKYINKGSLVIASYWDEKGHTISFEELTIQYDGIAKRKSFLHSLLHKSDIREEEFIPH
jgi:hypothetical protein